MKNVKTFIACLIFSLVLFGLSSCSKSGNRVPVTSELDESADNYVVVDIFNGELTTIKVPAQYMPVFHKNDSVGVVVSGYPDEGFNYDLSLNADAYMASGDSSGFHYEIIPGKLLHAFKAVDTPEDCANCKGS